MGRNDHADITRASFDEFISFLFDHDAPPKDQKRDPWYWHIEVTFDSERACQYYQRLFKEPRFLLERFSKAQLEQGFWAIQSGNLSCSVSEMIWDTDLTLSDREECVRCMHNLFADLFAIEPLDTAAHMWWDSLCYGWHCGNRQRERGGEDLTMQNVLFETLSGILALESSFCQGAALHGLGHLHHPETNDLIQRYLKRNPSLSEERKQYALAAARFDVL
jgi:hypothetical protein